MPTRQKNGKMRILCKGKMMGILLTDGNLMEILLTDGNLMRMFRNSLNKENLINSNNVDIGNNACYLFIKIKWILI